MKNKQTKQTRIDIVNEIIKEIANRGRHFFKKEDRVSYLFLKNNRLYMFNQINCENMNLYNKKSIVYPPVRFPHGGTIWGLTKDFRQFILTGKKCNGENGYGGLYSPHWGYSDEDMKSIQNKAIELGYL